MIRNSYHILDCNKNISKFNILEGSNLEQTQINSIKNELEEYHKHNNFKITPINNDISNQKIINNKFIFKKGYFFCSYLYHYNNNCYISEPVYEPKENPFCPKEDFTNIVISNTVPLNLNIVGVIYYYKYLSDKNQSQCKTNIYIYQAEDIVHHNNDKYVIDIVYFNLLLNNIKYDLTYIYYKNINYNELQRQTYKKTLKYNYLNYKNDDNFNKLSTVIENTIYKDTKELILDLQKSKQNFKVLLNFNNVTEKDTNSLHNILLKIFNLTKFNNVANNNNIANLEYYDCTTNIFTNYMLTNETILNYIQLIKEDIIQLHSYLNKVNDDYLFLVNSLYSLNDFGIILKNKSEFDNYKNIFDIIIEKRGDVNIENELTIYGKQPIILKLIEKINNSIKILHDTIDLLKDNIGNNIIDNDTLINNLKENIDSYMSYEINMNSINKNLEDDKNKLKIFIKNKKNIINVYNDKILNKYKKNIIINEDYTIQNLKNINFNIFNNEIIKLYKSQPGVNNAFTFLIKNLFKITKTDILNIYSYVTDLYNYLDFKGDKKLYPTLYDIFYNTKNVEYKNYSKNPIDHNILVNKYCIIKDGQITLKQKSFESIFKPLPKIDERFLDIYNNKNNILQLSSENQIIEGSKIYLDINNYFEFYINNINYTKLHFNDIKNKLIFNEKQITNCCKTYNVINEYNKHINNIIINTDMSIKTLSIARNKKKFENLAIEEQNYIRLFLKININIFSIFNKYINLNNYNISNNFYSICIKNFNTFISSIDIKPITDEMDILNIYYSLKNCFEGEEKNIDILDDFIIIFYCFSISMFSEHPKDYFKFLFSVNNNTTFNKLFSEVLHNKIYLYTENNTNYIKIISSVNELLLSEYILDHNVNDIKNQINIIKNKLIEELNKGNFKNIIDKLSVIQYFITNNDNNKNTIKTYSIRNQYNNIEELFRMINKYKIHNFNKNINKLIELTDNYKINTVEKDSETNLKYCVSLEENNTYECNPCDFSKKSLIKNLNNCPVNLPYNLDININNHLNSNLAFEADTYRIFSYISEPGKQLIYKRGRILYGEPKSESDLYEWNINKNYKDFTLLGKIDSNEDDPIIVKTNTKEENITVTSVVKNDLNIIYNNSNEFYLNNFNIKNIISESNLSNTDFKFPNSHQLYTKKEQNYYYIYFIENDVRYFMYLDRIKNKSNYNIVWKEDTYNSTKPFIKNYAKWRLIKTSEYVGNLFEDPRTLYNIRSLSYFKIEESEVIKGLVSNNNTCFKYDILLNNYLNKDYDLINNTKFKLTGFNNNYKIEPYIKYDKSIFNDLAQLQFLNYIKQQQKSNKEEDKNDSMNSDILKYNDRIKKYIGSDPKKPKISLYLIKNPENDTYLYLDATRNIIEFIPLFEDTLKNESEQLSKKDFIPNEFIWIIQDSENNDKLIKNKINKITTKYNNMVENSINNLNNNITTKKNKIKLTKLINNIEQKATQKGGNLLKINSDNIKNINQLIKTIEYIKYNDYVLLLKQLDLVKNNSKQVLESDLFYQDVNNRALITYKDYSTKSSQNIFIYFNYEDNRFISNITDITNITNITFNLKRLVNNNPLLNTDIEIIIDNNEFNNKPPNLIITEGLDNIYDNVKINISNTINDKISQIFIYINEYEFIINIKRADVIVYYNNNPIYNKLKKYTIKNTTKNSTFNIFNNLNIGKSNKTVYDFSVKLLSKGDKLVSKIYPINKNVIIENLITYNNVIGEFYIKKNKLEDNTEYNSKIFYVSNDRNILYINLYTQNTNDFIYSVPCRYQNDIENQSIDNIYKYICNSIYTHIILLKTKNKSEVINNIFNFINILYKNTIYNKLDKILEKNIDNQSKGYIFNSKKEINLYINIDKLTQIYNENDIPNKISIVFDKLINNKYINFDMKYTDFISLENLYDKILNLQFIKLNDLTENNKIYTKFINNTKNYITYIKNIKNNQNNGGIENIKNILNNNEDTFNIFSLVKKYFMDISKTDEKTKTFIKEFELYLYNLFISNLNINNYLCNLVLTYLHKIQNIYNKYSKTINNLLKEDERFLDCKHKTGSIVDILYNFIKFFNNYEINKDDMSFFEIKYGFYYKNNQDIYVNFVKKNDELNIISNNIYLVNFNDVIKNYNKIYPQLIQKNIKNNKLNEPYFKAYDTYIKNIKNILEELINIKYNNIKLNERIKIPKTDSKSSTELYKILKEDNKDNILNYEYVNLNSNITDKKFVHGDVVLYKFKRESKTNNMYNILSLLLPKNIENKWKDFSEFKDITINSNNINNIINKNVYIYSIANYNELFKSDLIDSYIIQDNLLLKEILPFSNKKISKESNNVCYFKLENDSIYLHLNDYKYKITLKKLIYSNLYLIIKNVNNINYYLEFKFEEGFYNYNWIKEDYIYVDNIMNKLLFINIESDNITDLTDTRKEIIEKDMIMITYKHKFKNTFSHLNKFISNNIGVCDLYDTYYTIHSKKHKKLIDNNNLINILDLALNKSKSSYILKDKFSKINEDIGNSKFYLTNYECNSYIIYNSYKNVILDNSFTFIELDILNLTLEDILENNENYKNYNINLKYDKNKDMFYELNEFCNLTKKSNKFKIQNISDNEKKAKDNSFYIYHISKNGVKDNLFKKYKTQVGLTETVLEDDMIFNIIPVNSINKKIIQTKNNGQMEDTELSLIPINQHSEYYLISNKKNEYLRVDNLIDYKRPLRVSLQFVQTNRINNSYLWYIKNNVENVSKINIKNDSSMCMVGGQNLILNTEIKKDYITKNNQKYLETSDSKYHDLCNNNTHVNFINYNMMETQDDVSYIECRNECMENDSCKGFSYSNMNDINKCLLYDNEGFNNGKPVKDNTMIYYDCNKSLTENKNIGEIKKTEAFNLIDLIDNNLYYIKCKNTDNSKSYIEFNKSESVFYEKNFLKCNIKRNKQDLYSDNIFKLKISKNNFNNGNIKLFSLLSENKHILGTYKNNDSTENNMINITYENGKYVWKHEDNTKWYLLPTNNIYEFTVVEGNIEEIEENGDIIKKCKIPDPQVPDSEYCCPYYHEGYTLLKINVDTNNKIISVEGPEQKTYTKMFHDENVSIFKNIKNLNDINSTDYQGNIFIVNKLTETSIKYYNIFSIFDNEKYYIYKDTTDNFIKFKKILAEEQNLLNNDNYLWNFEIYNSEITSGHSYQKIIVGGDEPNLDSITKNFTPQQKQDFINSLELSDNKETEQYGGIKKENLINNNLYYIKSSDDKYLCANKNYKINSTIPTSIAISINSKLATHPNKVRTYNNKFVRASINLSNTKYNIFKKHNINEDILWKLEKQENNNYKFYNIKHNIYLNINNEELEAKITEDLTAPLYYNLYQMDTKNVLTMSEENKDTLINNLEFVNINSAANQKKQVLWTFIKPHNSSIKNPYMIDSEFKPLENGKIYRIINEGIKDNNKTNTYLTVNELKNELLIPYNEKLFTSNLNNDPTLWKCIINADNTYSFICMYNNYKLGNLENQYSLLKNVGNKLNFKNNDISIGEEYLTDKFYIQHSNGEYYNIINSKNLDYYISGFSNDNNSYDNYSLENIKYTHKVANNSNWLLTCKLEEKLNDTTIFSDEPNYYLYGSKTNELKYSISDKYNKIYNDIYYEDSPLITKDNKINKIIKNYKNSFKKYTGFTINTNIICDPNKNNELIDYQKDNISIILTTEKVFYTIRFINFNNNTLLVRITCTPLKETKNSFIKQIESNNKLFNKLDYKENRSIKVIDLNICAPDIYTEDNIFKKESSKINLSYDNEFLNIYINNKLITYTRIVNTLFSDIYFTSNNDTQWNDTLWYKHKTLLDIPLWTTKNIDNFKNNKPGIQFTSKINKNVSFTATIEQKTIGYFYIRDSNNKYLSINNKNDNIYNVEFITNLPTDDSNCLWKLYDIDIDKQYKLKVLENEKNAANEFILNKNDFKMATDLSEEYINNIDNSTNYMLKTRLNKMSNIVDNVSNFEYSIIDINDTDDVNEKMCSWLNNKNGHTSIDYNPYLAGTHFITDVWNLQYIMGKQPKRADKFLVKYKNNTGIIEIDSLVNNNYTEFNNRSLTVKGRWNNFEKIKNFSSIKSQNNIYINEIKPSSGNFNNACITLNNDPLNPGAYCTSVQNKLDCNESNSVLFIPDQSCDNVLYKNYKLINGEKITGGKKNIKGGDDDTWIKEKYFYLNNINSEGNTIFNNINNVKYIPNFDVTDTEILNQWIYKDTGSKNIILNKIYSNFDYDGFIEDIENKIIRAVILPENFTLFTNSNTEDPSDSGIYERLNYIYGRMKSYNIEYKNIKVINTQEYFNKYSSYYINIQTKSKSLRLNTNLFSENYKLNKCYDLIKNNICISVGNNKTKMTHNISNNEFLLNNFSYFKDSNNNFRIVNMYGKYLSDLYINNTHLCDNDNIEGNKIVFQGQYDFIDLQKDNIHYMHSTSFESLWYMIYNEDNNTYKIINSYTNKLLNNKDFYIEYVDNKYFKQQFVNKTNSQLIYNNEDIFYIYYLDNLNKVYVSYEDILINNEYTKTSLVRFTEEATPFIIKKANYNLDILTDEFKNLPANITNICYNKTNICTKYNNIPLISNIKNNCLDISFTLNQLVETQTTSNFYPINKPNLYNLLVKNIDNSLTLTQGEYALVFNIKNINLNRIVYAFTKIEVGNNELQIKIDVIDKDSDSEFNIQPLTELRKIDGIFEYNNTLEKVQNLNNLQLIFKIIIKRQRIVFNYIELYGTPNINNFSKEEKVNYTKTNNNKPVNLVKSLISKKFNIENNLVKIKYINKNEGNTINNDLDSNIISIKNKLYNNPKISNIKKERVDYKFLLTFNSLLNCYMFYIEDNKYLDIKNSNKNTYVNGYYFKLIESNTTPLDSKYKLFNIQCFDNSNLYINVNNKKEIKLGSIKQDFIFINIINDNNNTLVKYNNFINNNILYNFYTKCVYVYQEDISKTYYYIVNKNLKTNRKEKTKLLIRQYDSKSWYIMNTNLDSKIKITNLVNTKNNTYMFTYDGTNHTVIIELVNNYNTLKIYTNNSYKKNLSFNDVNKTLRTKSTYSESLKRNKKYLTHNLILNKIILDNIVSLKTNEFYLLADADNKLIETNTLNEAGYFVEIKIGLDNLCKLWNYKYKKLIKYDFQNNLFVLDDNIIEYNDIDILNDIDITHIFEKNDNIVDFTNNYKLCYASNDIYLNIKNTSSNKDYKLNNITNISDFDYNNYEDYCDKICFNDNNIENKIMNNKTYNIKEDNTELILALGNYSIKFLKHIKGNYYEIDIGNLGINNNTIPINNFKEKNILKNIFTENTTELHLLIVTIDISDTDQEQLCNIIIWNNKKMTIGRFENQFDRPQNEELFKNKDLKIIYDSNYNRIDFNDNKNFIFSSYNNPPINKKYIKINDLTHDIINKFNISLFHYNNSEEDIDIKEPNINKLSNIRKLYTTCSWGNCSEDNILQDDITKISQNLKQYEVINKLRGGMLDSNMIRFLKALNNNEIDFYNSSLNKKYVNNNTTYYENNKLRNIIFKKNDIVQIHKIFGIRGWTNSYNSLYNKSLFMINSNNIKDIDYYDTFRNIYPISFLEKKYAFNSENLWKSNEWFEDSPHFRSLPFWKFEEVLIGENTSSNTVKSLEFTGGSLNTLENKINVNNNSTIKKFIYILIIIIVIYYLYKIFT